jgi:hypothetical protein
MSVNHSAIFVLAEAKLGVYSFLLAFSKSILAQAKSFSVRFAGTVQYFSCT